MADIEGGKDQSGGRVEKGVKKNHVNYLYTAVSKTTWFLHTKFAYILIFCNICVLLDEEYDKLI